MFPLIKKKAWPALVKGLEVDHQISEADYFPLMNLRWCDFLLVPTAIKLTIGRSKILNSCLAFHLTLSWHSNEANFTLGKRRNLNPSPLPCILGINLLFRLEVPGRFSLKPLFGGVKYLLVENQDTRFHYRFS